ncbi:MAG: dTDP-4-dehydrorhamnose 3,5-epimerase [Gemmatimonadota bacterium]
MNVTQLELDGVLVLELDRHSDERGWFLEFWNPSRSAYPGLPTRFVQDNIAYSKHRVLRGLHFQAPNAQGKLVTVTGGEVFDVAVDVRPESATFGQWVGATLAEARALYIPPGFAHGYQVISDGAHVLYKSTEFYRPDCEHALAWNDPQLAIDWPLPDPIVSPKDRTAPGLAQTRAALERLTPA